MTEGNPFKIFMRNVYLCLMHMIPSWRRQLRLGRRKEGMVRYSRAPELPFLPEYNGGLCIPQIYCKAMFPLPEGLEEIFFTDDVIFGRHKTGLFQLLVYLQDVKELASAREAVSGIEEVSKGEIPAADVTFLIEVMTDPNDNDDDGAEKDMTSAYRLVTAEEFTRSALCHGRPAPRFYDPFYLGKALYAQKYILVRPDRFVFAACDSKEDLVRAVEEAVAYLQG